MLKHRHMIKFIYEKALEAGHNNCVTRHGCSTSLELDEMDKISNIVTDTIKIPIAIVCYGCGRHVTAVHGNYVYSCKSCGDIFQRNRYISTPQKGKVAIVTGARTKLGHQICLKLLRAGATVFGTTRFTEKALAIFSRYPDWEEWKSRLYLYPLDMDVTDMEAEFVKLRDFISTTTTKVDILINCAAQTIRHREKMAQVDRDLSTESNRYGDCKFVEPEAVNSWNMTLPDITQGEMEELFRINSIAPLILTKVFIKMLHNSDRAFLVNVHAKEGIFNTHKTAKHMHTNMAKAALAMFTRCLSEHNYASDTTGSKIAIHGCDPGWISVDEYELHGSPWITPPLDEVDGAARILYPIWLDRSTNAKTRRHFERFIY